jgi:hypothetical protein
MSHNTSIDNSEDLIDSRDVIARIEELEELQTDNFTDACNKVFPLIEQDDLSNGQLAEIKAFLGHEGLDIEEAAELASLRKLADQCAGYGDWEHGEGLIRESYFKKYAQQLAEDCCEVPADLKWPYTCIDWDQAAQELMHDYTHVDFDGVTYLMRS